MELYLSNNKISEINEVKNLKILPKIIILDLSGNAIFKDPNYRLFTIYCVKKLKVLDGASIDSQEQAMAKENFTGRLTDELLSTRLNGMTPQEIQELDLSNCKIKDFEDIFVQSSFPSLKELNLSLNYFVSFRSFSFLPSLKILILHSNKLESFHTPIPNNPTSQQEIANFKKGLNGLQGLEILDVSNNQLKDFFGLQYCFLKDLKILKASKNELVKIEYLDNLKQLRELDVTKNKIRQIEPNSFTNLINIKCLKVEENALKSFTNLLRLPKLHHIFANSNRINDFPDLERLLDLPGLKELELIGNAVTRKPGYRQYLIKRIPSLLYLDGREITPEERERNEIGIQEPKPNPMVSFGPNVNSKVPVRLNAVNFEAVFSNLKIVGDSGLPPTIKKP
eukprot:TRINITY_DN11840_c0_g1_i2.p1 TRINITY_DN11840_c0_g1~~TRINITY_DN11840_c0_g1_i2.p1  ORF type:complete len:395 (+),score=114.40 TRINITY_DN11840_c0_g1_i2:52-1236(+)